MMILVGIAFKLDPHFGGYFVPEEMIRQLATTTLPYPLLRQYVDRDTFSILLGLNPPGPYDVVATFPRAQQLYPDCDFAITPFGDLTTFINNSNLTLLTPFIAIYKEGVLVDVAGPFLEADTMLYHFELILGEVPKECNSAAELMSMLGGSHSTIITRRADFKSWKEIAGGAFHVPVQVLLLSDALAPQMGLPEGDCAIYLRETRTLATYGCDKQLTLEELGYNNSSPPSPAPSQKAPSKTDDL